MKKATTLVSTTIIFTAIFLFIMNFGSSAQTQIRKEISRYKIAEEVLNQPHAMTAWSYYGECKQEWRQSKYFEYFPKSEEYRLSYNEELDCRRKLAKFWADLKHDHPEVSNDYLDDLVMVYRSIYLPEYVYKYYRCSDWQIKKDRFRLKEFKHWAKKYIKGHKSKTLVKLEVVQFGDH